MQNNLCVSFIFAVVSVIGSALHASENPIGEKADYMLDKASARTSGMILSGSANSYINEFDADYEHGPSYPVHMDFKFTVRIQGAYEGTMIHMYPESYFTPEFMVALRKTGSFETPDFKMAFEGRGDARTLDGKTYRDCDRVRVYDIKNPQSLIALLRAAAGDSVMDQSMRGIEDLVIRAYVHPTVPVLGAVKLDITGKVSGVATKVGFDYRS